MHSFFVAPLGRPEIYSMIWTLFFVIMAAVATRTTAPCVDCAPAQTTEPPCDDCVVPPLETPTPAPAEICPGACAAPVSMQVGKTNITYALCGFEIKYSVQPRCIVSFLYPDNYVVHVSCDGATTALGTLIPWHVADINCTADVMTFDLYSPVQALQGTNTTIQHSVKNTPFNIVL